MEPCLNGCLGISTFCFKIKYGSGPLFNESACKTASSPFPESCMTRFLVDHDTHYVGMMYGTLPLLKKSQLALQVLDVLIVSTVPQPNLIGKEDAYPEVYSEVH